MRRLKAALISMLAAIAGAVPLSLEALSDSDPQLAASIAPWSSNAQRLAAQEALTAKQPVAAAHYAGAAIAAMPVDQFALAAASAGKPPSQQLAILNLAAGLGWRDPATNIALIRTGLAEQEPAIAAQRIDALGRTIGAEAAGPFADKLLQMDGGPAQLTARAQSRTGRDWWQGYFRSAPATKDIAQWRSLLIQSFDHEDGAWLRRSVRDAAIGFAKGGFGGLSLELWRKTLPSAAQFSGPLYDPEFAAFDPAKEAIGGEWKVARLAPALVTKNPDGGIAIEFSGGGSGLIISQTIALSAGVWQVTVEGSPSNEHGARWQINCPSIGKVQPSASTAAANSRYVLRFELPSSCPIAELALVASLNIEPASRTFQIRKVELAKLN